MSAAAAPPEGGGALSASDPTSLLDRSSFKEELRLWALRLPSIIYTFLTTLHAATSAHGCAYPPENMA